VGAAVVGGVILWIMNEPESALAAGVVGLYMWATGSREAVAAPTPPEDADPASLYLCESQMRVFDAANLAPEIAYMWASLSVKAGILPASTLDLFSGNEAALFNLQTLLSQVEGQSITVQLSGVEGISLSVGSLGDGRLLFDFNSLAAGEGRIEGEFLNGVPEWLRSAESDGSSLSRWFGSSAIAQAFGEPTQLNIDPAAAQIGEIFGSQLGSLIAGDDPFA
jgi:hypothetical protein